MLAFYRDLVRLRRNVGGVSAGLTGTNVDVYHLNDAAKVMAYRRWSAAGDDCIVVANFANHAYTRYDVGLPAGGTWHVRLNSDSRTYSSDFGDAPSTDVVALSAVRDGKPFTGPIALGPYSVVVLSR